MADPGFVSQEDESKKQMIYGQGQDLSDEKGFLTSSGFLPILGSGRVGIMSKSKTFRGAFQQLILGAIWSHIDRDQFNPFH